MIVRVCDRCSARVENHETSGAYRATLTSAEGESETIADFEDLCRTCLDELRNAHAVFRRRRGRTVRAGKPGRPTKRLSWEEGRALKRALVDVLREHGGTATSHEIMRGIQARGLVVPGRHPDRNLTSYLSRHPKVANVKPGLWRLNDDGENGAGAVATPSEAQDARGGANAQVTE